MFPWMKLFPHEKLFRLFLYTIFISRSSSCSSNSTSSSNSSSNNAGILVVAVIINDIILQIIVYDRHIFVHLLLSCSDSVIGCCSC
jgi:hypothetical protein